MNKLKYEPEMLRLHPLWVCTQGECEQQQAEAAEVQRRLLVHLCHCVQRHAEQQRGPRERWTVQEGQQDGTHHKIACVRNTCPHGRQAQAWNYKTHKRFKNIYENFIQSNADSIIYKV